MDELLCLYCRYDELTTSLQIKKSTIGIIELLVCYNYAIILFVIVNVTMNQIACMEIHISLDE
jgi:hypothetical protein